MVAHLDSGIPLSNKKEWAVDGCMITNKSLHGYVRQKNQEIKSILHFSINKL